MNLHQIRDLSAPVHATGPGPALLAALAQAGDQFLAQFPARQHVERGVDRLVRSPPGQVPAYCALSRPAICSGDQPSRSQCSTTPRTAPNPGRAWAACVAGAAIAPRAPRRRSRRALPRAQRARRFPTERARRPPQTRRDRPQTLLGVEHHHQHRPLFGRQVLVLLATSFALPQTPYSDHGHFGLRPPQVSCASGFQRPAGRRLSACPWPQRRCGPHALAFDQLARLAHRQPHGTALQQIDAEIGFESGQLRIEVLSPGLLHRLDPTYARAPVTGAGQVVLDPPARRFTARRCSVRHPGHRHRCLRSRRTPAAARHQPFIQKARTSHVGTARLNEPLHQHKAPVRLPEQPGETFEMHARASARRPDVRPGCPRAGRPRDDLAAPVRVLAAAMARTAAADFTARTGSGCTGSTP